MKLSVARERTSTATATYNDQEIRLVYAEGRCTPAWMEQAFTLPVRWVLAQILVSWDITTDEDEPYEPQPLSDSRWAELAVEIRVEAAQRARMSDDVLEAERVPLTDDEIAALRKTLASADEILETYQRGWEAILMQLPQMLLVAVFDAVWEDLKPGPKPKPASVAS